MRYIRSARLQPGYSPNARHVIYGQDADLLLLALLCHEPRLVIMRECMDSRVRVGTQGSRHGIARLQGAWLQLLMGWGKG